MGDNTEKDAWGLQFDKIQEFRDKEYRYYFEGRIKQFKQLIKNWVDEECDCLLKTDLWNEAKEFEDILSMFDANKYFGIDISKAITGKAYTKYSSTKKRICFTVGCISKLPFKDQQFDVIISHSTLDHFQKNFGVKALTELNRVLKPDGTMIITIDNLFYYTSVPLIYMLLKGLGVMKYVESLIGCEFGWRPYSYMEFSSMLEEHGFRVDDWAGFNIVPALETSATKYMLVPPAFIAGLLMKLESRMLELGFKKNFLAQYLAFKCGKA